MNPTDSNSCMGQTITRMRNPARKPDNVEVSKLTSRTEASKLAMSIRSPREARAKPDFLAPTLGVLRYQLGCGASNEPITRGGRAPAGPTGLACEHEAINLRGGWVSRGGAGGEEVESP